MIIATVKKKKFFSKKFLLITCYLLLITVFVVELFYARKLKAELARREAQMEQALAQEEEEVVTPAMLREELNER